MTRLLRYLRPYSGLLVLLAGLVVVQAVSDLMLPAYMSSIVDQGIIRGDAGMIWLEGAKMLGFALLSTMCAVIVGMLAARVGAGFSRKVRGDLFAKVESFSMAEVNNFSTASLITRCTNDVQQVQMVLIMLLRMFLSAPITGVVAITKALERGRQMGWIMAVAVLAVTAMVLVLFLVAIPKFKLIQKKIDRLNLVARENLTGLRVIRAFNTQAKEEEKFDRANSELMRLQRFIDRMMRMMFPFMMLVMNLTALSITWFGARMIGEATLQVGDLIAFIQYTMQVIMSFLMLTAVFIMVPRASVSGNRISDVLETETSIKSPAQPKTGIARQRGRVEFQNVTFSYPDAEGCVLKDINFTAEAGTITAFIGSTGSGKSTLINLIPRFYDVTGGKVLVGGIDVREYALEDLYSKIGFVAQRGVLFSGTVDSNLRLGMPHATEEELREALTISQAAQFVEEMDGGLQATIAQGGTNVSGGQRQRLSIARAVAMRPDILIFDDSFSALDYRTDAALRASLRKHAGTSTVLMVAQRIATIRRANQIIVLEHGEMVGKGTHDELMRTCDVYREIALSQLSEEELA